MQHLSARGQQYRVTGPMIRLPTTLDSATPYGATLGFTGIALSDNSSTLQACR
jgi:hypothetical protein